MNRLQFRDLSREFPEQIIDRIAVTRGETVEYHPGGEFFALLFAEVGEGGHSISHTPTILRSDRTRHTPRDEDRPELSDRLAGLIVQRSVFQAGDHHGTLSRS